MGSIFGAIYIHTYTSELYVCLVWFGFPCMESVECGV